MTEDPKKNQPENGPKDRIIAALDVASAAEAREIINELRDEVGAFKIGLQLFTSAGSSFVRECTESGVKIFLDLKFHDIPNTVAMASVEAARLRVWMFNVHASGGGEMMSKTVDAVERVCNTEGIHRPLITAVTVLTSSNAETLREIGSGGDVDSQVLRLADLARRSGTDGVVASALEAKQIRDAMGDQFVIVTPGIRPSSATKDDQTRVTTPKAALENGSDHLVIGRPIIGAHDRVAAVRGIVTEIEQNDGQ